MKCWIVYWVWSGLDYIFGQLVGLCVGFMVGSRVGPRVGSKVGSKVGSRVGYDWIYEGYGVCLFV